MQPNTATTENQVAIAKLRSCTDMRSSMFFGILPDFKYAMAGKTKSNGVNPMAPHMDTKSPKKGIAAAMRVIRTM
jgi:hypothetical protein